MALASTLQEDFSGGMYRGRRAPATAFYDAVNALVDDEGKPFKRGGSSLYSASDTPTALLWLAAVYLRAPAKNRVIAVDTDGMNVLDASLNPVAVGGAVEGWSRPASVGDYAIFSIGPSSVLYYAGSLKASQYTAGTITVTVGSATVTGSGTSWLANADAGMILLGNSVAGQAVVKSVDSDTQITLTAPWTGGAGAGKTYILSATLTSGGLAPADGVRSFVAAAGSGVARLLLTIGNRVYATSPGDPTAFDPKVYLELPANVNITGAEGYGDSAVIFTTEGMWRLDNLSLDPIDDAGNQQWIETQINKDLALWDDFGIASFSGTLIVPAIDDVYLVGADGSAQPITGGRGSQYDGGIRNLYRSYVKAGYRPGMASTLRGHYVLPIMDGVTVVDVLVCRLDHGMAWTRWANGAAGGAYAKLVDLVGQPRLLGLAGARVSDLTGCFDPTAANAQDAGAANFGLTVESRDFATGSSSQPGTVDRVRARYVLTDDGSGGTAAPSVAVAVSSDQDAGVYSTLTDRGEQGGAAGWGVSDGSQYQWAKAVKRRERLRVRITQTGACASFVLRSVELLIRQSGRQ